MNEEIEINIVGIKDNNFCQIQEILFKFGFHWQSGGRNIQPHPKKFHQGRFIYIDLQALVILNKSMYLSDNTNQNDFPNRVYFQISDYESGIKKIIEDGQ